MVYHIQHYLIHSYILKEKLNCLNQVENENLEFVMILSNLNISRCKKMLDTSHCQIQLNQTKKLIPISSINRLWIIN